MRARLLILLVRSVVCQIVERIEVALPRCVGLPEDSPQPPVENIPLLEANARCCLLSRKKDIGNLHVIFRSEEINGKAREREVVLVLTLYIVLVS